MVEPVTGPSLKTHCSLNGFESGYASNPIVQLFGREIGLDSSETQIRFALVSSLQMAIEKRMEIDWWSIMRRGQGWSTVIQERRGLGGESCGRGEEDSGLIGDLLTMVVAQGGWQLSGDEIELERKREDVGWWLGSLM